MSNKVKVNKHTGEMVFHSSSSREDRAIIIKKVDGILSFPIKVENIQGNKEDENKVIYGLYYEDSLLQDSILLLTYENRDDAIAARKAIERAYFKSSSNALSSTLKVLGAVTLALIIGKYMLVPTNNAVMAQQSKSDSPAIPSALENPDYDRSAIMKTVEDFKEKQRVKKEKELNEENALQPDIKNDNINPLPDNNDSGIKNDNAKTEGQEFADFLNGKK